jgi:hypothetical protein
LQNEAKSLGWELEAILQNEPKSTILQSTISNLQSKKRTQTSTFLRKFRGFYFSIVNCTLSIPPLHGGKRTQICDLQSLLLHLGVSHRRRACPREGVGRFHTFALSILPFAFCSKRPKISSVQP